MSQATCTAVKNQRLRIRLPHILLCQSTDLIVVYPLKWQHEHTPSIIPRIILIRLDWRRQQYDGKMKMSYAGVGYEYGTKQSHYIIM